jgi:protein TonB
MAFRKNRSQYFWVFGTYSLALHLAGFLTLAVLVGSHIPDSVSSLITVRLVDVMPVTPQIALIPTVPKAPQPNTVAASQKSSNPTTTVVSNLFHMIRPGDTSSSPIRHVIAGTNRHTHSIIQVASTVLPPEEFAQPISQIDRVANPAHSSTRILVDHKAEQSLTATTPPKILFNPVPQYPRIARVMGLEGKTLLRVEILQDGRPGTVHVRESSGHTVLDEAAAKAIKKWKFTPAQDGFFAVRSVVDLPIRFSLKSLG